MEYGDDWPYGYDEDGEPVNPFNAWGPRPIPRREPKAPDGSVEDRRYICTKCREELTLPVVKRVERIEPESYGGGYGGGKPEIRIIHACTCRAFVRKARYPFDHMALRRLFKGAYTLPWPTTYAEEKGEVASDPPVPPEPSPLERRELVMARARFDLGAVESADDFLMYCRGPRSEDDSIREEFAATERKRRDRRQSSE